MKNIHKSKSRKTYPHYNRVFSKIVYRFLKKFDNVYENLPEVIQQLANQYLIFTICHLVRITKIDLMSLGYMEIEFEDYSPQEGYECLTDHMSIDTKNHIEREYLDGTDEQGFYLKWHHVFPENLDLDSLEVERKLELFFEHINELSYEELYKRLSKCMQH